jgi:hypothetical protein
MGTSDMPNVILESHTYGDRAGLGTVQSWKVVGRRETLKSASCSRENLLISSSLSDIERRSSTGPQIWAPGSGAHCSTADARSQYHRGYPTFPSSYILAASV